MTSATPGPTPSIDPPRWAHCAHGATIDDPVGCRGIHLPGHTACLAHLDETDRAAYLVALTPDADIDHRGTPFTTDLLDRLLDAVRDPTTGNPRFGNARFNGASFTGDAVFRGASFTGDAVFGGVTFMRSAVFGGVTFTRSADFARASFTGNAVFSGASFSSGAVFNGATFTNGARFENATFSRDARFDGATFTRTAKLDGVTFTRDARFDGATFTRTAIFNRGTFSGGAVFSRVTFTRNAVFSGANFTRAAVFNEATFAHDAKFSGATFTRDAVFSGATVTRDARFDRTRFEMASRLALTCGGTVNLDGAVFSAPVTVEVAAGAVTCRRIRWSSAATLRLRYAHLDLSDAVLEYPLTVTAHPTPFPFTSSSNWDEPPPEMSLSGRDAGVRLTSVGGVDAAHLVLHDIDLASCRFAGAIHLDQLRVDGWCTFATTPAGTWRRRFLLRWWSQRSTLAEEHHWRARVRRPAAARGWMPPPEDIPVLRPAALAALYRQVRKSLEDGKNEPDAADFYYGEMEMRRHDATRPWAERSLLSVYWAVSGYGLRAGRALGWLLWTMAATLLVLMLWGLPAGDTQLTTTGR